MSSFLSTPVYHVHQQAQSEGLSFLSRSEYLEITAALFGYEHYRLMKPMLQSLEAALRQPDAAVIFAERSATGRAAHLLAENGAPKGTAQRYVSLLISHLASLTPGRAYTDQGSFWADHLDPYVAQHFLRELDENPEVRRTHEKVRARCQIVTEEDTDEVTSVWQSREVWEVWKAVAIYARRADGQPDITGEYLLAQSVVAYRKLERAVVSTRPMFSPANASANRYHAGMGGEAIR